MIEGSLLPSVFESEKIIEGLRRVIAVYNGFDYSCVPGMYLNLQTVRASKLGAAH